MSLSVISLTGGSVVYDDSTGEIVAGRTKVGDRWKLDGWRRVQAENEKFKIDYARKRTCLSGTDGVSSQHGIGVTATPNPRCREEVNDHAGF